MAVQLVFLPRVACMPKRLRPGQSGKVAACHRGSQYCRRSRRPTASPSFARSRSAPSWSPWVVYLAGRQEGWDQPREWFDRREGYRSEVLTGWQWARAGRSPVTVARGLGTALDRIDPACVVSWEYGPATWRALAWCRRRRRPLLIFSEVTPWTEAALSRLQSLVHRLLAPRVDGFIAASSQSAERLARLGVDRGRVEVALQSADVEPLLGLEHRGTGAGAAAARAGDGEARARQESAPAPGSVRRGRRRRRGRARAARQRAAGGGAERPGRPAWPACPHRWAGGARRPARPCTPRPTCSHWSARTSRSV